MQLEEVIAEKPRDTLVIGAMAKALCAHKQGMTARGYQINLNVHFCLNIGDRGSDCPSLRQYLLCSIRYG